MKNKKEELKHVFTFDENMIYNIYEGEIRYIQVYEEELIYEYIWKKKLNVHKEEEYINIYEEGIRYTYLYENEKKELHEYSILKRYIFTLCLSEYLLLLAFNSCLRATP